MTKTELEKLKGLPREIETLADELDGMAEQELVGDTYNDYRTGYKKIKVQTGLSSARYRNHKATLKNKIIQKGILVDKFEQWIETVPDADMRRLLRYIYLHGMSQKRAAEMMGREWTRDRVNKRLERFFKKIL
ncbi:MAG: hypothetical protein SOR93_09605 [Clostridiales Family XIII bacterium]|nr:hypothetical protein [Clostridia bacterium]MDY3011489.1 hypothetical protein [Clostridiales Family XIII bacterium]